MHPLNYPIARSFLEPSDFKNPLNIPIKEDLDAGQYGELVLNAVKNYIMQIDTGNRGTYDQAYGHFFDGLEGLMDLVYGNIDEHLSNDDEELLPDDFEEKFSEDVKVN